MNRRTSAVVAALLLASFMISGCVAAAAGAAGGVGAYRWGQGKLTFTTNYTVTECHDATISAFKELGITVVSDSTDKLSGRIKGTTPTGESVAVDLEPQGMRVTSIDVRVGFWGNQGQSTKVADTIKKRL
jgi:predicted small secreted protein